MKVLDCESTTAIYNSLESILGVDRSTIESRFEGVDIEGFYKNNPHHAIAPEEHLFSAVSPCLRHQSAQGASGQSPYSPTLYDP